tara:strand:- start:4107 stop:4787 length:681 start_codon:yes stop_codon:yes gene_type:complete
MKLTQRELRKLMNSKQDTVEFRGTPSMDTMLEGQVAIEKKSNSLLALYRKRFGKLWKVYMSADGNQIVDKKLTTNALEYQREFIDYRVFMHNFTDDIGTSTIYIPWQGTGEQTAMNSSTSAFLTPFNMSCYKMLFRPETLSAGSADFTFTLVKQDDGDTTVDTVATFTYTTTLASDTLITINESDWNNAPKVEAGDKVAINVDASTDPSGEIDWYVTSVWRVKVVI